MCAVRWRVVGADLSADIYQDVSLSQWLALTPPQLVKAHLNVSDATIAKFTKVKGVVV
jgi:oxalate decarboxylase/phosphoglucose isomerase-like protein (cupin superfamily)